jgi:ketosteroid isomerase-like protein
MSVEQSNVATLRQAYGRWAASKGTDGGTWSGIMSDDVSLGSLAEGAPEMPFTARRSGKEQLLAYLDGLARDWEMVSYEIGEYVAQGDRVVAIGRCAWRHRATGKVAESPKIDIWRFRDGKAVAFEEFYDTARVFAAATP